MNKIRTLRADEISDLRRQVKYELIPTQRGEDGKVIERDCTYIADFVYLEVASGKTVVEDVKGYKSPRDPAYAKFTIKRKLMLYRYGIHITEV